MSYTKRQFVESAFSEIGLASYVFDLQPDQLQDAMRRMDAMLASWNSRGIRIGYPIPSTPENADLDTETGVPDRANEAIITGLAIRLAPGYGKQVPRETAMAARDSYRELLRATSEVPEQQYPSTLPRGAGQKPWRDSARFYPDPVDPLTAGPDSTLDLDQ